MSRRAVILFLCSVLAFFAGLDFMLWHIDYAGVVRYTLDYADLQAHAVPAPDGIRYEPGTYALRMYTVTIGADGLRAVPESRGGACRIAFVGDSIVFGMGSDISFVDLLAPDIDATVINAGIPGYGVENVAAELDSIAADGYVWLAFRNDSEPPLVYARPSGSIPPALLLYRDYLNPPPAPPLRPDYFREHAAPILTRADVLVFAFDGLPLSDIAAEYGAHRIPNYHYAVSKYDGHANERGNAEVADSMRDAVAAFVERTCHN